MKLAPNRTLKNSKTHCVNGHEFTPENSYVSPQGNRACRACKLDAVHRFRREAAEQAELNRKLNAKT